MSMTDVVCPDCGKYIAPKGSIDPGTRCRCGDEADAPASSSPLQQVKRCYVCSTDITNRKRLKDHLIALGEWSEEQHEAAEKAAIEQVREAGCESEAIGTIGQSRPSVKEMFEDVFATPDWRIQEQRGEVGV